MLYKLHIGFCNNKSNNILICHTNSLLKKLPLKENFDTKVKFNLINDDIVEFVCSLEKKHFINLFDIPNRIESNTFL